MPVIQTDQGLDVLLLLTHSNDRPGDLTDVDFSSGDVSFALYLDAEAFCLTSRVTSHPVFNSARVRFYPDSEAVGVWFDVTASVGDVCTVKPPTLILEAANPAEVNRHVTDALLHLARKLVRH